MPSVLGREGPGSCFTATGLLNITKFAVIRMLGTLRTLTCFIRIICFLFRIVCMVCRVRIAKQAPDLRTTKLQHYVYGNCNFVLGNSTAMVIFHCLNLVSLYLNVLRLFRYFDWLSGSYLTWLCAMWIYQEEFTLEYTH